MKTRFALLAGCLLLVTPTLAFSAEVVIPRGTVVFGELEERITSNENKFRVGYEVDSHVWKDVIVDGHVVIPAGTPMVSSAQRATEIATRRRHVQRRFSN